MFPSISQLYPTRPREPTLYSLRVSRVHLRYIVRRPATRKRGDHPTPKIHGKRKKKLIKSKNWKTAGAIAAASTAPWISDGSPGSSAWFPRSISPPRPLKIWNLKRLRGQSIPTRGMKRNDLVYVRLYLRVCVLSVYVCFCMCMYLYVSLCMFIFAYVYYVKEESSEEL